MFVIWYWLERRQSGLFVQLHFTASIFFSVITSHGKEKNHGKENRSSNTYTYAYAYIYIYETLKPIYVQN